VQNFGYLVRLGGLKFLHLGDVDYAADNLEGLGFKEEEIDVVFLPTFNTLISEANRDLIIEVINPKLVIGLHFLPGRINAEPDQVLGLYPDVDVFTQVLEWRRY